jgi:hypothetical protein
MTDLWKFSETPLLGGSLNEGSLNEGSSVEEEEENKLTGGMSVADFFCQKQPDTDSKRFTFFTDLTVPFGLVYLPPCNESSGYTEKDDEDDEPKKECGSFDKLFSMSSTTLGKKESNRRTRKKI